MSNVIDGKVDKYKIVEYIYTQLNHFFPDNVDIKGVLNKNISEAVDRVQYSLRNVKLPGYQNFNILHSDIYAQFIYYLSNTIWVNDENKNAAIKLFYLNKALHGLNCMYDTILPDIFLLIHSVGTVLGKAHYSNHFVACHNVTVGSDKGISPRIMNGVYMGPGSSIVGNSTIGEYTHLTINCVILDQDTPKNCVVIGDSPNLEIKNLKRNLIIEQYFFV